MTEPGSFASEDERRMSDRELLYKAEALWAAERGQLQGCKERVELVAVEIAKKVEVASKLWDVERQRLVRERDEAERRAAEAVAALRVLQASVGSGGGGGGGSSGPRWEAGSPVSSSRSSMESQSPVRSRLRQIQEEEEDRKREEAEEEGRRRRRVHRAVTAASFVVTSALFFRKEGAGLVAAVVKGLNRQVLWTYRQRRREAKRQRRVQRILDIAGLD